MLSRRRDSCAHGHWTPTGSIRARMAEAVAFPRLPHDGDLPPVVAFWPWDTGPTAVDALRGALAGTPAQANVILPAGSRSEKLVLTLSERARARITIAGGEPATGLAGFLATATESSPRADVVLIAGAGRLPDGWLGKLRRAAYDDDAIAAASAATSQLGQAHLPGPWEQPSRDGPGHSPAPSAHPPRILMPWPVATWIRRTALDLAGDLEDTLRHPAAVLGDFAARALSHGMGCVLADGVVVGGSADETGVDEPPAEERETLWRLHPWLREAWGDLTAIDEGPLRRSLVGARAARFGLSVTIDARALGPGVGGTQTYVGALVLALAEVGDLSVRAVLAHDAPDPLHAAFAGAGVETIDYEQAAAGVGRTDVVHRPQQVFTSHDLRLLRMLGERIVVSHMDLIAFRNPTYHASLQEWRGYRRSTRLALAAADRVVFFSDHARRDAIGEELVTSGRSAVAGIGVQPATDAVELMRPETVPAGRNFLLLLGADYAHKNRPFALELTDQLRARHGWDGMLVLAGTHVANGSSADAESAALRTHPELAQRVVDLGQVSEPEKQWLLRNAVAHICASSYEGFGLAPLEAAAVGRPCIYAPWTSLAEIVDPAGATIVPWDASASADAAVTLLSEGDARDRHLARLAAALQQYQWPAVAAELVETYRVAVASPYRASAPHAWEDLQREEVITVLNEARLDLQQRVAHGQPLIDRRAPLLTQAQRRGLMRVASRRWLRGPLLGAFGLIGIDDRATDDTEPGR
jgi:glycosyltransferase involved in cell wall biosynthesis